MLFFASHQKKSRPSHRRRVGRHTEEKSAGTQKRRRPSHYTITRELSKPFTRSLGISSGDLKPVCLSLGRGADLDFQGISERSLTPFRATASPLPAFKRTTNSSSPIARRMDARKRVLSKTSRPHWKCAYATRTRCDLPSVPKT